MTDGVDLTLVIRKKEGQLTVSSLPRSNNLKDEAQNHIIPLVLIGAPAELDGGFLQTIGRPMQKASGLISNLAQFEQQAAKAASSSKANKEQKNNEPKEAKDKRERCDKYIKKAEEQIAAQTFAEALQSLQQARLCATEQMAKTIDDKITEVKMAMRQGSLFDMPVTPAPPSASHQGQPMPTAPSVQQSMAQPAPQQAPQMPQQQAMPQPYYGQPQQPQQWQQPQQPMPGYHQMPQQYGAPQFTPQQYTQGNYSGSEFIPCREDEYAQYPDLPVNMQPGVPQVQPQSF